MSRNFPMFACFVLNVFGSVFVGIGCYELTKNIQASTAFGTAAFLFIYSLAFLLDFVLYLKGEGLPR